MDFENSIAQTNADQTKRAKLRGVTAICKRHGGDLRDGETYALMVRLSIKFYASIIVVLSNRSLLVLLCPDQRSLELSHRTPHCRGIEDQQC